MRSTNVIHVNYVLILVAIFGFSLRIVNLDFFPPMVDETGALWESINYSAYSPFNRILMGKYFGFLLYKPIILGANNPLYFARVLTIVFSLVTIYFIYLISKELQNKLAGLVASALYAISPFAIFHDRQAIFDPIATTLFCISIYLFVIGVNKRKLLFLSGIFYALMSFTKITCIATFPIYIVLWIYQKSKYRIDEGRNKNLVLSVVSDFWPFILGVLAGSIYLILIAPVPEVSEMGISQARSFIKQFLSLSPENTAAKNSFYSGALYLWGGFNEYMGIFFVIILILTCVIAISKKYWLSVGLIFTSILSVLFFGILSHLFYRYIHFIQIPIYLSMGIVIARLYAEYGYKNFYSNIYGFLMFGVAASLVYFSICMMHNPYSRIASGDLYSYKEGWPSANGINNVTDRLSEISINSDKKIVVVTSVWGSHGPWTLPLMFRNSRLPIIFYKSWLNTIEESSKIKNLLKNNRVIIFMDCPAYCLTEQDLDNLKFEYESIYKFQKIDPNSRYELIEIIK